MGEISWSDIEEVARLTNGQRDNTLWLDLRRFRLTGSNFGQIFNIQNSGREDYENIRSMLFDQKDLSKIPAIQWGVDHEQHALELYQEKTHYTVRPTGLWLFPNATLGASPDGLVYAGNTFVGIVEVKCPYSLRSFQMSCDTEMVVQLQFLTKDYKLNKSHNYYHQVQAQIYATHSPWCDFFVWTPSRYLNSRVYPDHDWQSKILPTIQNYFINKILRPLNNPRQLVLQIELLLKNNSLEPIPILQSRYTQGEISHIAQKTIGQHKNPIWLLIQPGLLSANLFYYAYLTAMSFQRSGSISETQQYLNKWAKAMFNYQHLSGYEWGNTKEQIAIQEYEHLTGQKVSPSGVWLFPNAALYAAPDGLVYSKLDQTHLEGIIEVKCPIEFKYKKAAEVELDFLNDSGELRHSSRYYYQVQGHLAATQADWCDFIIWGPHYFNVQRIFPDQDWVTYKLTMLKWAVENLFLPLSYSPDFWENIMTC